ncbi:hypothetical protein BgiMline_006237, partial [Biomphalaria glabrata]
YPVLPCKKDLDPATAFHQDGQHKSASTWHVAGEDNDSDMSYALVDCYPHGE